MSIRNILKKTALSVLFLLAALSSTFAKDGSSTLKVGFLTDMPYLMHHDERTDHKEGYGYDYLQVISNFTGWKYEYVYGEWYALWKKFLNGEIDILEDISYIPEREKLMLFPDIPMGQEKYRLYVYDKDSEISADNLKESLKGKKVGITAQTVQLEIFKEWAEKQKIQCEIIGFYSDFERNEQLASGKIDAAVELEASSLDNWEPIIEIGATDYYMALSKGNEEHLKELNKALYTLESVVPDFRNELLYRYYSREIISSRLTADEQDWVNNHKVLRCGYFDDLISNSKDNPGIFKVIIDQIKTELDLNNLEVEYFYYPAYDQLADALQADQIDLAYPLCSISGSCDMGNYSKLTDVSNLLISAVTQKGKSINDAIFIGIPDSSGAQYHAEESFPRAKIIRYSSVSKMFDDVADSKLDAAVLPDNLIENNLLKKQKYSNLEAVRVSDPFGTSIAAKKGNVELFTLMTRGVSLLNQTFISDTVAKNTKLKIDYSLKTFIANHLLLFLLLWIFIAVLIIYVHFAVYKRRVMQKNYEKEKSLRNELAHALKLSEEHKQKERELLYLSETDKLTGIANRGAEGKIKQFLEIGTSGMFCLFDVDKFKSINDNYGHLTGDKVLMSIADCMKKVFRETDIILRLGGDEFAAYTIGITDKETAMVIIKRLFAEIDNIEIPEMKGAKITVSLGASFFTKETNLDFESIYKLADTGCYMSKKHEGCFYTFVE